jgi:hypothetical protein
MHNNTFNKHHCRVCGLFNSDPPWGEDGKTPTFIICDCCGVEFGYEDSTIESTNRFRDKWMNSGCCWFNKSKKPKDWNLHAFEPKSGIERA